LARLPSLSRRKPRTAFVLGGGGNLGAVQVGMLRALTERRIRPDVVVGCSVGALNGAAYCADPTLVGVARIEELWRDLDGRDVLPTGWYPAIQLARRGAAVHDNSGLRRVVEQVLPVSTFEELALPFECVATAFDAAGETWFSSGDLVDPIVASSAIPAVYPPVTIDGVRYIDGAVVNDIPISRAIELGARLVYVLHVGSFDRPRPEPKRPVDVAVQAYWIARRYRFARDLASLPREVEAVVLPTGNPGRISFNDFTHGERLMTEAHRATAALLLEREQADGRGSAALPPGDVEREPPASADA
jgi:NTE family protein